jgi:hypothetical protein
VATNRASICHHSVVSIQFSCLHQVAAKRLLISWFISSAVTHVHACLGIALAVLQHPTANTRFYSRRSHHSEFRHSLCEYHNFAAAVSRRVHVVSQRSCLVSAIFQDVRGCVECSYFISDSTGSISLVSSAMAISVLKCFLCTSSSATLSRALTQFGSSRCGLDSALRNMPFQNFILLLSGRISRFCRCSLTHNSLLRGQAHRLINLSPSHSASTCNCACCLQPRFLHDTLLHVLIFIETSAPKLSDFSHSHTPRSLTLNEICRKFGKAPTFYTHIVLPIN